MKYLKFIVTIAFAFFALTSYSQNLTYRDLVGEWKNLKGASFSYQFIDSANLRINSSKYGVSNATYSLKDYGQHFILTIEVNDKGIKHQTNYYVKRIDAATLRLENINTYDPIVQTRPVETAMWLIRQKS